MAEEKKEELSELARIIFNNLMASRLGSDRLFMWQFSVRVARLVADYYRDRDRFEERRAETEPIAAVEKSRSFLSRAGDLLRFSAGVAK